jgi:hypothetical protein
MLDLLKRLDVKVDFAAIDWGTLVTRWTERAARPGRLADGPHQPPWRPAGL